jgi:integrase
MNYEIHKATTRTKLPPRAEPYWATPLGINQSIGFRKTGAIGTDEGTWIARRRKDNGILGTHSLGWISEKTFGEARTAAFKWFVDRERGISGDGETVEDACKAYVKDRATEKSATCSRNAETLFKKIVYDTPFGRLRLDKLRTSHVKTWRNGFIEKGQSKSTANRKLNTLRAALNLAVENSLVSAASVIEWKRVKIYPNVGKRRELYLDLKQRRALLAHATGTVRDLIEAAALTGARAGELTSATRSQFDGRAGTLALTGKTGPRTVPLSPAGLALFTRLSKSKLLAARLLTRDDGKPWLHSGWDQLVRDAAKAAKLPIGCCLYTLRHSYITTALQSGMSVSDVGFLVGTSAQMIQKNYYHVIDSHVRAQLPAVVMV